MSFLDALIPGSRRHRIFAEEFDAFNVRCVDLEAVNFSPATIDTAHIDCQTLTASTSIAAPTITASTSVTAPTLAASTSITTPAITTTAVQTSTINSVSAIITGGTSCGSLSTPLIRAITIQGTGVGTPQVAQIRVATAGDSAQKITDVWATNVGSQAVKTDNIHANNLFATSLGSPANKVNLEYANQIVVDTLSVNSSPVFANAGIQMNGYVFNSWYREDPFSMTISSGFLNTTSAVTAITQGLQGMYKIQTKEFTIYSYEQSGSDDAFYIDVPYLQSYQMSGYIQFSTSNDPSAFNLAIAFKEAGNSQIILAPINYRHFQNGQYSGQDLYFKAGLIICSEF